MHLVDSERLCQSRKFFFRNEERAQVNLHLKNTMLGKIDWIMTCEFKTFQNVRVISVLVLVDLRNVFLLSPVR